MGFWNAKTPALSRKESLLGVPLLNGGVELSDLGEERLLVRVEVPRPPGLLARLQPRLMEKRIKLDALGSFVIRLVDGKRSVLDIIDAFTARFAANRREAELSVVDFLKELVKRRVLSIAIKG